MSDLPSDTTEGLHESEPSAESVVQVVAAPEAQEHAHHFLSSAAKYTGIALTAAACGGFIGAAEGAFTPTDVQLGPHQATAQLTLDHRMNFDLGPLGSATKGTTWVLNSGAKVTIKGVPAQENISSLSNISSVLTQYEELFSDPTHIKDNAIHTVETRIWHDGVEGIALGEAALIGMVGISTLVRRKTSDERKEAFKTAFDFDRNPLVRRVAMGLAVVTVAAACSASSAASTNSENPNIDHALDGTTFQGYAIHGELLRLIIDEAAPEVIRYIDTDDQFYVQASKNVSKAFAEKFANDPIDYNGIILVQNVSDNHCNIGMDKVHGAVAREFKVDLTVDSGDTTMSGTAAEEECVSAFADEFKNQIIAIRGNHDSPTTEAQERKLGDLVVGDDKITKTKSGLTFLGEGDPRESVFGTPIHLRGKETIADEAANLKKAAQQTHPDVLLVHDPDAAIPTVKAGLVPLSISGDTHVLSGPNLLNSKTMSYQFTEGTSGGVRPNSITIGPLKQNAIETIFAFDKKTHLPLGYYIVTVHTDASVEISNFTLMPQTAIAPPISVTPGD